MVKILTSSGSAIRFPSIFFNSNTWYRDEKKTKLTNFIELTILKSMRTHITNSTRMPLQQNRRYPNCPFCRSWPAHETRPPRNVHAPRPHLQRLWREVHQVRQPEKASSEGPWGRESVLWDLSEEGFQHWQAQEGPQGPWATQQPQLSRRCC